MMTDYQIVFPSRELKATVSLTGTADELENVYRYFEKLADIAGAPDFPPKHVEKFLHELCEAFLELREYKGYLEPSHE